MAIFKKPAQSQPRGRRLYNRSPVAIYYRSKTGNQTQSPFQKKELPKNHRKYVLGAADIVLLVILLAGLVYSLLVGSIPKVSATDLSYRSSDEYQTQVDNSLAGVKNRNKITFDEAAVTKKIQAGLPEVQTVQIELPFFSEQPNVKLIISPPSLKLTGSGGTYIVDSQGVAVMRANNSSSFASLPVVTDQSGYRAQTGQQVLSSDAVSFIDNLIKQCRRAKVPIKSLILPALPQELDLRTTDQPYYVKFYLGGDAGIQAGQFLAARHQFAQNHQNPSRYLDVRVAGKIYYK